MAISDTAPTPHIVEILNVASRLTSTERLLVARLLLDSVLSQQNDEENDWQQLSVTAFEATWDNEEDAIYDNWRDLYGVATR